MGYSDDNVHSMIKKTSFYSSLFQYEMVTSIDKESKIVCFGFRKKIEEEI